MSAAVGVMGWPAEAYLSWWAAQASKPLSGSHCRWWVRFPSASATAVLLRSPRQDWPMCVIADASAPCLQRFDNSWVLAREDAADIHRMASEVVRGVEQCLVE